MKTFVTFMAIGSVFAPELFPTIVVLRRDVSSYLFTLLVLFPTYLSFVYFSTRIIDRLIRRESARDLAHLLIYGFFGLFLEWSLMGLPPGEIRQRTRYSCLPSSWGCSPSGQPSQPPPGCSSTVVSGVARPDVDRAVLCPLVRARLQR